MRQKGWTVRGRGWSDIEEVKGASIYDVPTDPPQNTVKGEVAQFIYCKSVVTGPEIWKLGQRHMTVVIHLGIRQPDMLATSSVSLQAVRHKKYIENWEKAEKEPWSYTWLGINVVQGEESFPVTVREKGLLYMFASSQESYPTVG